MCANCLAVRCRRDLTVAHSMAGPVWIDLRSRVVPASREQVVLATGDQKTVVRKAIVQVTVRDDPNRIHLDLTIPDRGAKAMPRRDGTLTMLPPSATDWISMRSSAGLTATTTRRSTVTKRLAG